MQDGVVTHALETESHGQNIDGRKFSSKCEGVLQH